MAPRNFGARRADVLRLIVGSGLKLAAAGIAIGIVAALLLRQALTPFVYQVSAADPATFLLVIAIFLVTAAVATLAPSLRAARLPPAEVLRSQ